MNSVKGFASVMVAAIMVSGLTGCTQIPSQPRVVSDLEYTSGARNQMDLYLPANVEGAPVVVFVHGGRWFRRDKSQIEWHDRIAKFNEAGFVIAAFNYAYSTDERWPAQLEDAVDAVAFVREQAATYGYAEDRLALYGQSAGAHVALMATLQLAETPDSGVDAIVSWYAPSDLYNIVADRARDDVPDRAPSGSGPSPEEILLGVSAIENKAAADAASPVPYLRAMDQSTALPPILIVHGDSDNVISPIQSDRLYETWQSHGGSGTVELRIVEGAGHGGEDFDGEPEAVIEFLKAQLGE